MPADKVLDAKLAMAIADNPPSTREEIAILRKTIQEIQDRGWARGDIEYPDGTVCLLGAISAAYTGNPNKLSYLSEYAVPTLKTKFGPKLDRWNDSSGEALVIASILKTITEMEEQISHLPRSRWKKAKVRPDTYVKTA